jgi:hypothetical protein
MAAHELIDIGDEPSGDERHELIRDLMFALVDKHGGLTVPALSEIMNQLIMQHGLRDAVRFV